MSNPCALPSLALPPTEADLKGLPALERKLARRLGEANAAHRLIEAGDRILVAVSGGKDSWALLDILERLRKRAPVTFQVEAATVDPGFPQFNPDPIAETCERIGVPHHVISAPIDRMVRSKPDELPCIICSRLRRGVLYSFAKQQGFSKIALGHHLDDLVETLLINLFFEGRLSTMPLRLVSDDGANTVIRPLGTCEEKDLQRYAWLRGFPIVPCGCPLCGCSSLESRRKQVKELVASLETTIPRLKASMLGAMGNVKPSHLLDLSLGASIAKGGDEAVAGLG
ncbi:tRNA 2-thiocytidine(32) synthetase TtcA [Geothrix sp. 21YS21S-4]|uniref:tRNA 2-thiocytidine(32) synthetase TtcA n=1 Tax=Geothrix sp. 21YS21S-4 TaxID=3068889 RepID=UPI0027B8D319|nr:tRNA 2-thiocytidine(32) synthetase TtcA [Geothrix sp. 21YS21S-4]